MCNSLFKDFLASSRHQAKCYNKSIEMLLYTVFSFIAKWINSLSYIPAY